MTFATRLKGLGLRQAELARLLSFYSGRHVPPQTVNRWCAGSREPPAAMLALLAVLELRPELVVLLRMGALDN